MTLINVVGNKILLALCILLTNMCEAQHLDSLLLDFEGNYIRDSNSLFQMENELYRLTTLVPYVEVVHNISGESPKLFYEKDKFDLRSKSLIFSPSVITKKINKKFVFEHLEIVLKYPLEKDSLYAFDFVCKYFNSFSYKLRSLGILLSANKVEKKPGCCLTPMPTFILNISDSLDLEYTKSSFIYRPDQDINRIYIGVFCLDTVILKKRHTSNLYELEEKELYKNYSGIPVRMFIDNIYIRRINIKKKKQPTVYFTYNSDSLNKRSKDDLVVILNNIKKGSKAHILLNGFTDSVGNDDYNYLLSLRRCNSVKNWFTSRGIDESRISVLGYGKRRAKGKNKDERKVEISLF